MQEMKILNIKICPLFGTSNQTGKFTFCLGRKCAFCRNYGYGQEICAISEESIYMDPEDVYKATILIPEEEYNAWNDRLMDEAPDLPALRRRSGTERHYVRWSAQFSEQYSAAIYIEPDDDYTRLIAYFGLYENGNESPVLEEEIGHFLQTDYQYTYSGATFNLHIERTPF